MTTIHAQLIGDQALLPLQELEGLIEIARRSEEIDFQMREDDLPAGAWMRFAEQSGAFDFWKEEGENIYSIKDGEPI
ncbi:MAG: hypothetical protein ACREA2_03855 [Blastocatellia bacterium]